MSITIKDCLNLPSLSLATVLAGHKGLDNIVTAVSVMEFDDPLNTMATPNELVITAFYTIRDDVNSQCRALHNLKREGDVGLVLFYSDIILQNISQKLIDTANMLDFPLILVAETDIGLRYSDVISDVMEAIFIDRKNKDYFVNSTIKRLSQLPVANRNISSLMNFVSNYSKASLFLCDSNNRIISCQFWPSTAYFDFSIIEKEFDHTDSRQGVVITYYNKIPYTFLRESFIDKNNTKLNLYAATQNNKLTSTIMNEIVEIIQLFVLLWNYKLDISEKEALLSALLDNNLQLSEYICKSNNMQLNDYNSMLLIFNDKPQESNATASSMLTAIRHTSQSYAKPSITDVYADCIISIFPYSHSNIKDKLFINDMTNPENTSCSNWRYIFIGNMNAEKDVRRLYLCLTSNQSALRIIFPCQNLYTKDQLLFAEKCSEILDIGGYNASYHMDMLLPIIEDQEEGLLDTLSCYLLDGDSEIKKTSELMFLHRNTILYRLNKIKDLLGYNPFKMPIAADIYTSAALYRLQASR